MSCLIGVEDIEPSAMSVCTLILIQILLLCLQHQAITCHLWCQQLMASKNGSKTWHTQICYIIFDVACGRLCMAKTCTHEVDRSRKHVDFGLPHWSRKTIWGCWQPALAWLKNGDVRRLNIVLMMMMMARRLVQLMRQHIDKGQTDD